MAAFATLAGPAPDTSTPEGRGLDRFRRAGLSAAAGAAARLVNVATALISVPLTIRYLGGERYGLWMTISSATTMLTFVDLGLGNGLLNVIADASGRGDRAAAKTAVSSSVFLLGLVALGSGALFGFVYPWVDWGSGIQRPLG